MHLFCLCQNPAVEPLPRRDGPGPRPREKGVGDRSVITKAATDGKSSRHPLEASLTRKGALSNASVPCSLEGNQPGRLPEDSETLEIQFVKGGVYPFFKVPSTVFDEFMSAPSKEGYYHERIGERFPCSRVA